MPTPAGNKQLFLHFFRYRPRLFQLLTENLRADQLGMDIKVLVPAPTQKIITKTNDQKDFPSEESIEKSTKIKSITLK